MSVGEEQIKEQKELLDKLASLKDKVLQNKPARYSLAFLFLFLAILLFLPILVNNNALKGSSVKKLKEVLGQDVLIKGDMNVEILPSPKIIARDILILNYSLPNSKYSYNLYAKKAEIKLRFFYSSKSSAIKEIKFSDLIVEKKYISSYNQESEGYDIQNVKLALKNKYQNISNKVDKSASGINLSSLSLAKVAKSDFSLKKFPRINISNAKIITYDVYDNKREYNSLNCDIDISSNKIKSDGYFVVEDILTSFETKLVFDKKIEDKSDSYLQIKSPSLNFRFDGDLASPEGLGENFEIRGSFISEIKDLKDFYLSYVGAKSAFAAKLKNNTPLIKINAKISSNKDGSFVDDLKIVSPIINGSGSVSIYKSSTVPIIDILLDIKDIDVDAMWSTSHVKVEEKEADQKANPIFGIDKVETFFVGNAPEIFKKDFDLTLEIKSALAVYKSTTLRDLNIYLNSHNYGQLIFNPISFSFPGNGKFHANGELNSSGGVPKFVGKINVSGEDPERILSRGVSQNNGLKLNFISKYKLYSNLVLLPSKMDLENLFINLNEDETELSGNLNFAIVDKKPLLKGKFRINNINIQDQVKNFNIKEYTHKGSLIEKVFWLNDLSYETSLELKLDKISYDEKEFFDNTANVQIKRGKIILDNVVIAPKSHNSRMNFVVDISKSTPELSLSLYTKNLALFSEGSKEDKVKYISNKDGAIMDKGSIIDANTILKKNAFDQFFDFVSLNGFSGELRVAIEKMRLKNQLLENFKFNSKLNNGVLDNVLITTKSGNTDFQYEGTIGLKKIKTLSGTALLKNARIQPMGSELFNLHKLDAVFNASMAISSFGGDTKSFVQNIDGELKFNSVAPEVRGYGLNNLIRKMFFPRKNIEALKAPEKIVDNENSNTRFKNAVGSVIFRKGNAKVESKVEGILSNSVLIGNITLVNEEVDLAFNTIFMTGSRKKLTPIAVATNISGKFGDLLYTANYDQVLQYLGLKKIEKTLAKEEGGVETQDGSADEEVTPQNTLDNKTLEQIRKERLNKAKSVLRRQGIQIPEDFENNDVK